MFAAVLDTCTIYPSVRRDFFLSLAVEGVYRPLWSEAILDELHANEIEKLTGRLDVEHAEAAQRADHLIAQMRIAFPDAIVDGWQALEGSYGLPDINDEHVLAAAHVGGAGALVTENLKDFPAALVPSGIEVVHPTVFALNAVELSPESAHRALAAMLARSGASGPSRTKEDLLDILQNRYGMSDAVALLRSR